MRRKKTIEEFIEESKLIHGDKYNYSLVEYKNKNTNIDIICQKHGVFKQLPKLHLKGCGCIACFYDSIRFSLDEFINLCNKIHNNKYDYSLVEYVNVKTKIKIICPIHGIFEQRANSHLSGQECMKCKIDNERKTLKEFINESKNIHGEKYNYSLVEYKNCNTKIKIICPKHGIFEQYPPNHLIGGCKKCANEKMKLNQIDFLERCKKIHGDKYDYSLVEYELSSKKVKIICLIHGIFEQSVNSHLNGRGCRNCYDERQKSNTTEFIKKVQKIHGCKYDYSLVEYKNSYTKIDIICPVHGIFKQTPDSHLRLESNCPNCKTISKSEIKIFDYFKFNNILFETQKTFDGCKNKNKLRFDFYLPEHNTCIEYDGYQHNTSVSYWGGENGLKYRKNNDKLKNEYCEKNNIRLIRIQHDEDIEDKLDNFKT